MATIKFSEFDAGNISLAGTQLVGLSGGNTAVNARFTAADLVNGLATITYVDTQDAGLQSQITQNTNDILAIDPANINANIATLQGQVTVIEGNIVVLEGAVAALESNVSVNQDDIAILQGNVVSIEAELANIADTDAQTLTYDGATANLSISNGNNVVLQEVLDNASNISSAQTDIINLVSNQNSIALNVSNNNSNITVIQGQISDLQANGNIQTLGLDNASNVLSISGGNNVDFTTVLGNAGGGGLAAVVDDTSPQLGGTLNSNGFNIELSSGTPVEFGIEWNDGFGTKYGDIVAQPDSNEFEISSGSVLCRDLVLIGDRDVEIKTGFSGRDIIIADLTWPASDGTAGQAIVTDGAGTLSFATAGGGNPFNQDLDTTDSPTFDNITTTGELDVNGSGTHTFEGTLQFTQLTNFGGVVGITSILDEDDMVSDSPNALATQQSIKAYVDANAGGGGGANIAVATASDGRDYLTTFDTSFFITADPTATDTGYIAMGESAAVNWNSGAYELHGGGSGGGKSLFNNKTITNKISSNGPHIAMAASNDFYLGTRYAALYTDASYDVTLSSDPLGSVNLAIDNTDKLVIDGPTDTIQMSANVIPSANITYDLGSETNRWKDLWLSGNTIHLGGTSISADDGALSVDGLALENTYATTSSVVNTATEVYNSNGILPADPKGMAVADPSGAGGWYWSSPGTGASPIGLNSFQWKMFNNNGPQTYTVADVEYLYMIVDLYTVGQVYFNIYTGTGPIATTFTSRFSFTLNGDFASTGRFLMWAKPPGSTTTVDDVEVYPFLERLELPYAAVASSGPLLTSEPIKSVNVQTRTSPALTAGEVEFNLKNVGYKVKGGYIQNFDMDIYNPFDQGVSTTDTPEFQGVTATTGTVRLASLTTTERNNLTPANGDMIYNTTDSKLQGYQAGVWVVLDGS